uniref:Putative metalloprotease n=1 Tax=Ixodes ricinus TaxID=34613 RepID=A0A0K8RJU8_IXORI
MNALRLRELLLLLLSASVSAQVQNCVTQTENAASNQSESQDVHYVGVKFLLDSSILSCTPFKKIMEEYLQAFVGGVGLRFMEPMETPVKVVYEGWRPLSEEEERNLFGNKEDTSTSGIKGGDAITKVIDIALEGNDGDLMGRNIVLLVLTWNEVTEDSTKKEVGTPPIPGSDSESESESDEGSDIISVRLNSNNRLPNVGGIAQYGSMCVTVGTAICQDNGKNFSGVGTAARLIATVLGSAYNGSLSRRKCDDEEYNERQTVFHNNECYAMKKSLGENQNENDCRKEMLANNKSDVTNPSQFFKSHPEFTPCGMAYQGSTKCEEKNSRNETEQCLPHVLL